MKMIQTYLNHNKSVFTQSRTLHRVGGRSSSISRSEIKFISHLFRFLFKQKLETKKEMRSRLFSWFGDEFQQAATKEKN